MALREDSTKITSDIKSDGASSDICVVDNSNDTSQESNGWRHSSPANNSKLRNSHQYNKSDSFMALLTPSPPNKTKPVSSLKRKILAPSPPNSPKRPNKDLIVAIEKLRPIQKYCFVKPNGESPNFKFAKDTTKFIAHSLTTTPTGKETRKNRSPMPSFKNQQRQQKSLATIHQKQISPPIQSNEAICQQFLASPAQQSTPQKLTPQQADSKGSNSLNAPKRTTPITSPLQPTQLHILEQIIINQPNEIHRQTVSNIKNQQKQQQHMQQLQQQRQQIQQQLQQVEQQLQQQEYAQQGHQLRELLLSPKRNTQTLQRYTEPQPNSSSTSKAANQPHSDTPPITPSTTHPQQKPTYDIQLNQQPNSYQKPPPVGAQSPPQESSTLPWTTQMEQQQSCLQQENNPNLHVHFPATQKHSGHSQQELQLQLEQNEPQKQLLQHATPQVTPKHLQQIPCPQPAQRENSKKIPSIFVPKIASIDQLLIKINESTDPILFTTTSNQEGGVRIKCNDTTSYSNLLKVLEESNIYLHTHQLPQDKGLRFVIKNLHATTDPNSIRAFLTKQGYSTKYVNVLKNRFTGMPLNIFEVEIATSVDLDVEKILAINKINNQEVVVERQARRTDPVQCHRCQAFGHSKNYCRRPFVCLKCAGNHPTTECKKDKNTPGLCANCGNQHIASYKGCPIYKAERAKLLAVRLSIPTNMHDDYNPVTIEQQPPKRQLAPTSTLKQISLPSKQPVVASQPEQSSDSTQRLNSQPLQQRPRRQQLSLATQDTRLLNSKTAGTAVAHMTYSQVAHEGALNSPRQYTPNRPLQSTSRHHRILQPPSKHPQQQLQQQLNRLQPHITPQSRNVDITATQPTRQDQENSHQINEIKSSVANNERSIISLSEKVDMLYKLVNDLLTPIIQSKQNQASENMNHEQH